ncbi:unnamed protein product [Moneuplotes crassus]|uniref:Uncharacterized protein n=1 Tax=Euplotes crassus TaxID=5936 RepID=A0AAD1X3B5_EUPCR|nr:unnamed protein product [Moneuplotes crassus]
MGDNTPKISRNLYRTQSLRSYKFHTPKQNKHLTVNTDLVVPSRNYKIQSAFFKKYTPIKIKNKSQKKASFDVAASSDSSFSSHNVTEEDIQRLKIRPAKVQKEAKLFRTIKPRLTKINSKKNIWRATGKKSYKKPSISVSQCNLEKEKRESIQRAVDDARNNFEMKLNKKFSQVKLYKSQEEIDKNPPDKILKNMANYIDLISQAAREKIQTLQASRSLRSRLRTNIDQAMTSSLGGDSLEMLETSEPNSITTEKIFSKLRSSYRLSKHFNAESIKSLAKKREVLKMQQVVQEKEIKKIIEQYTEGNKETEQQYLERIITEAKLLSSWGKREVFKTQSVALNTKNMNMTKINPTEQGKLLYIKLRNQANKQQNQRRLSLDQPRRKMITLKDYQNLTNKLLKIKKNNMATRLADQSEQNSEFLYISNSSDSGRYIPPERETSPKKLS